ncbi:hypothetical protein MARA_11150 [Mycolicibacterium arabiense]|uniref:Uncharacterized protein n=1 Tax=Mycolicibacterium arabiense TaxID=1286181 RepID=A0A7I7RSX3_9MYCO|nr:hypothetical protein [Mycolicibacterium arabiense]MCV7375696.1 hypothetical protein [Mycolicibacterium arabiense]BBY47647.1 hypothetical protein MARA_11150 [Mycolicibacterium arabiense]
MSSERIFDGPWEKDDDGWETVPTKNVKYRASDGGIVVVDDTGDYAAIGDGFAFRKCAYHRDGVSVAWEIRDGTPQCLGVMVRASEDAGLRTKDLHAIRLDDIREIVYLTIGIGTFSSNGEDYEMQPRDARKVVAGVRRKVTPALLKRVAEIHRAAPEGRRVAAVKAAFDVHERTALRYIKQAREARYL